MTSSKTSTKEDAVQPVKVLTQDGGRVAWLQCAGAFCLFFNSWGLVNAFGSFETYYEHGGVPGVSPSQISWIGSLQAFLFVFGGAITGPVYDAGYLRTLVRFGSLTIVFGMMMTSISSQYWHFILAQGLVIGIGNGCLFVPSVSLLPQYFAKRRALSVGIALIGGNLGGVIYAIVFHRLQPSIGFPWTVRIIGFMMLAILTLPMYCLRMRIQPSEKRRLWEASAWTSWPFSLFAGACFIGLLGLYIPYFYVATYALQVAKVDSNISLYLVPIMNAGSIAGRVILSFTADKMGSIRTMAICAGACAVLSMGWIGCRSQPSVITFCVLYGFFSGTIISLVPTVVASNLCTDLRYLGLRIGMVCLPCSLGFLIGTPIGGALEARSWLGAQLLTGFTLAIFCGCLVILGTRQKK